MLSVCSAASDKKAESLPLQGKVSSEARQPPPLGEAASLQGLQGCDSGSQR